MSETHLAARLLDARLALPAARPEVRSRRIAAPAWDEDAVTLSAKAALQLLDEHGGIPPQAVVTATTTAPLEEPGIAPWLVEILGLDTTSGASVHVSQHGGGVSAGAAALVEAMALLSAGVDPVLVVAADTRHDHRSRSLGAGAAAALLSVSGEGDEVQLLAATAELFLDRWRRFGHEAVETGDRSLDRYTPGRAFAAEVGAGVEKTIEISPERPHVERAGHLGAAALLTEMVLADLDRDESVVLASSSGGVSHAFRLTARQGHAEIKDRAAGVVAGGDDRPPPKVPDMDEFHPYTSQAGARRERGMGYRLEARRHPESGAVVYPPPPDRTSAGWDTVRLARTGTVHTFARDHVYPVGAPLTMAVVDLDGGGRFYGQVVDGKRVEIGDRVELELRRLHVGGGVPHYFWKLAPGPGTARDEGAS